ncbi:MAG TPA: hypothetical protein VFR10_04200 [bacterium]|nr:hypothetical protein [bacterium]
MHSSPSLFRWSLEIFLEPSVAIRRMRESPPILAFGLTFAIFCAAMWWSILSVNERAMARLLADGVHPVVVEQSCLDLHREKIVRVAAAPMEIALYASAAMIALCMASWVCGRSPPYRALLTAAVVAQAPQLLSLATDLELLWNDGPEVTLDLRPILRCSTSVAAFFATGAYPSWMHCALEEISPFTIWSAGLVGIAARELGGASRLGAFAVSHAALLLRIAWSTGRTLAISELVRRGVL